MGRCPVEALPGSGSQLTPIWQRIRLSLRTMTVEQRPELSEPERRSWDPVWQSIGGIYWAVFLFGGERILTLSAAATEYT